jgi:MFS family permease
MPLGPPPASIDVCGHNFLLIRRKFFMRIFYGWWIVGACLVAGLIGNALGLYGAGVYLHALVEMKFWPPGLVSGAVTLFFGVSALLLIPVGGAIQRFGPRPVIALGAAAMAGGVAGIGQVTELWQVYVAFLVMGIGWACLSTTAVASTLAPWFEKYQGRAVSIASLGASMGGMLGAPALLFGIGRIGFATTTTVAGVLAVAVLLPLAGWVLKHRPQDMGLLPDGNPPDIRTMSTATRQWTRGQALRTSLLRSVMVSFGFGMMVQVGFLTHQVTLLAQSFGVTGISATVSATAVSALLGRLILARFADQIDDRVTAAVVLLVAALALIALGACPAPTVLVGASILFGFTIGNVTTLSPIIVRREFGAASFGRVFGAASCGIQFATAFGPGFYGLLHDVFGSYRPALLMAAALDVSAAAIVMFGRRGPKRLGSVRASPNMDDAGSR